MMHSEPPQPSLSNLENAMRQEFFERVVSPLPSEHLSEDDRHLVPDTSFLVQLEVLGVLGYLRRIETVYSHLM
jgi:hypothetical protein